MRLRLTFLTTLALLIGLAASTSARVQTLASASVTTPFSTSRSSICGLHS